MYLRKFLKACKSLRVYNIPHLLQNGVKQVLGDVYIAGGDAMTEGYYQWFDSTPVTYTKWLDGTIKPFAIIQGVPIKTIPKRHKNKRHTINIVYWFASAMYNCGIYHIIFTLILA